VRLALYRLYGFSTLALRLVHFDTLMIEGYARLGYRILLINRAAVRPDTLILLRLIL